MSNQKIICGKAKNTMLRLAPQNAVIVPKIKVPHTLPKLLIEPIHDSCSFVMGPVMSGVLFESRTGNAGETQATHAPWLNITMFAESKEYIGGEHTIWQYDNNHNRTNLSPLQIFAFSHSTTFVRCPPFLNEFQLFKISFEIKCNTI